MNTLKASRISTAAGRFAKLIWRPSHLVRVHASAPPLTRQASLHALYICMHMYVEACYEYYFLLGWQTMKWVPLCSFYSDLNRLLSWSLLCLEFNSIAVFFPPLKLSYRILITKDIGCQINMDAQSVASRLSNSGLLRSQGLIGGKWVDAYDRKTLKVCHEHVSFPSECINSCTLQTGFSMYFGWLYE